MEIDTNVNVGEVQTETQVRVVTFAGEVVVAVQLSGVGVLQTTQTDGYRRTDIWEDVYRNTRIEREFTFVDIRDAGAPRFARLIAELRTAERAGKLPIGEETELSLAVECTIGAVEESYRLGVILVGDVTK